MVFLEFADLYLIKEPNCDKLSASGINKRNRLCAQFGLWIQLDSILQGIKLEETARWRQNSVSPIKSNDAFSLVGLVCVGQVKSSLDWQVYQSLQLHNVGQNGIVIGGSTAARQHLINQYLH